MTAIFISHRSTDNATAIFLKDWLAGQGHRRLFLDFDPADGIPAGVDWEQRIYHELRRCQAVLVVLTPDWHASKWCFAELALAREQGKPVFVARAKPTPGGPVIPALQEVDLTADREGALAKLARGLKECGLDPRDAFDWKPDRPVYPGLAAFEEEDAAVFFGRGEESWRAVEALERLRRQGQGAPRLLLVTGASGSGKSSLMRAGILPRLMKDPGHWLRVRPFRRGADPFGKLAEALIRAFVEHGRAQPAVGALAGRLRAAAAAEPADGACLRNIARDLRGTAGRHGATVLLALDQAEELLAPDGGEGAHRLLHLLRVALAGADHELMAVATIRSDMLGVWQQHPAVRAAEGRPELTFEAFPLGPMPLDRVPEVVRGPARYVGLEVDDDLVDAIRRDVVTPDALPLLAYTLRRLHDRHGGGRLTLRDYEEIGRLEGSIRGEADAAIKVKVDELSAEDREALRAAFVPTLVRATENGGFTREWALREWIPRRADPLIDQLVDARLLVADRDGAGRETVEVAHEALLRVWPSLATWLAEDADRLRLLEGLRRAAEEWARRGRRTDLLVHRGQRLQETDEALAEPRFAGRLEPRDVDYLKECRAAQRLQEEAERRQRNRVLVGGSVIIALLTALVGVFFVLRGQAEEQRDRALANETRALAALSVEASLKGRYTDALILAVASWPRRADDLRPPLATSLHAMGRATEGPTEADPPLRHPDLVRFAAFSPDGKWVLTASEDGTMRLWDAATGDSPRPPMRYTELVLSTAFNAETPLVVTASKDGMVRLRNAVTGAQLGGEMHHDGPVRAAAFSPDGTRVLTASEDSTTFKDTTRLWDADTGDSLGPPMRHDELVLSTAFNAETPLVVTASKDGMVRLRNAVTGAQLGGEMHHDGPVRAAAFSPDGTRVVTTSERTVWLWNATNGERVAPPLWHEKLVTTAALDRGGTRVITISLDRMARLWDAATGAQLGPPLRHEDHVRLAALSADGARVITASNDRTARLWDVAHNKPIGPMLNHNETNVLSAAFSPDGMRVVTAGPRVVTAPGPLSSLLFSKTATLWDAADGVQIGRPMEHDNAVLSAAFSPDGTRVVTASADGTARLWSATTGKPAGEPLKHKKPVNAATFSPDGKWVLTASDDGTAQLWDATTGARLGPPLQHQERVLSATFSRNELNGGAQILTISTDKAARLWNAATGEPIGRPMEHDNAVLSAAFSPDGTRVVTASADGTARLWSATTGKPAGEPLKHKKPVNAATFSPDGKRVLTASDDGMAQLWDASTGVWLNHKMSHDGRVRSAVFSPDGTRVLTASEDNTTFEGTMRLWDAATGEPLGPHMHHGGAVPAAAFSLDGTRVVAASIDGTARLWDVKWPLGPITVVACALLSKKGSERLTELAERYEILIRDPICGPDMPILARARSGLQ